MRVKRDLPPFLGLKLFAVDGVPCAHARRVERKVLFADSVDSAMVLFWVQRLLVEDLSVRCARELPPRCNVVPTITTLPPKLPIPPTPS